MENCKVKIFFGMSGALKLTTINSMYGDWFKVYSDTKPFYEIDEKYLNWSSINLLELSLLINFL